jgi:hypothetical protein
MFSQNYTCTNGVPSNNQAIATLYDISCGTRQIILDIARPYLIIAFLQLSEHPSIRCFQDSLWGIPLPTTRLPTSSNSFNQLISATTISRSLLQTLPQPIQCSTSVLLDVETSSPAQKLALSLTLLSQPTTYPGCISVTSLGVLLLLVIDCLLPEVLLLRLRVLNLPMLFTVHSY